MTCWSRENSKSLLCSSMASQSSNGLNMANDEAVSTSLVIING